MRCDCKEEINWYTVIITILVLVILICFGGLFYATYSEGYNHGRYDTLMERLK